jgi:hypothetical protein
MAVSESLYHDPAIAGPLGTLALSVVRPRASTLALCAVRWHHDLKRLGVNFPFALVHDLGLALGAPAVELEFGRRVPANELVTRAIRQSWSPAGSANLLEDAEQLLGSYDALIQEIAHSELARRAASLHLNHDLMVVLLARLVGAVSERCPTPPYVSGLPLDPLLFERIEERLLELFDAINRASDWASLRELVGSRLYALTWLDSVDSRTLELFGLLGGDSAQGPTAQVDLLSVLGSPEASQVVSFSLEILPSVLEAKTHPTIARHTAFGYAGLSRRGNLDGLVLTELAWDEPEMLRRIADDEVLYYAREQVRDQAERIHYLLIDASASMRGERATFARGMALAVAKKLILSGESVVLRFFDSRLYEPRTGQSGRLPLGHLLSFRGERGRNPARVFRELIAALDVRHRRDGRQPVVHLFTHAALYIPRDLVAAVAARAKLLGVFILPSAARLELDYLDLLTSHWVVDHAALASPKQRGQEARRILSDVGALTEGAATESMTKPSRAVRASDPGDA